MMVGEAVTERLMMVGEAVTESLMIARSDEAQL